MTKILVALLFVLGASPVFAWDLECKTKNSGDLKYFDFVVTAQWLPAESLTNVALLHNGQKLYDNANGEMKNYRPRNPAYAGMNRYELPDSTGRWSTTSLLLPAQVDSKEFDAYFYDQGHSGIGTITLTCIAK